MPAASTDKVVHAEKERWRDIEIEAAEETLQMKNDGASQEGEREEVKNAAAIKKREQRKARKMQRKQQAAADALEADAELRSGESQEEQEKEQRKQQAEEGSRTCEDLPCDLCLVRTRKEAAKRKLEIVRKAGRLDEVAKGQTILDWLNEVEVRLAQEGEVLVAEAEHGGGAGSSN